MLNLYHLKYFYDAVVHESLSKAAEQNLVSHSAVSQSIRALEKSLGFELLEHSKNRFVLTPEGQRVFQQASAVFEAAARIKKGGAAAGPLRIGVSHALGKGFLTPALAKLRRQTPELEISVRIGNAQVLERQLETREIDVGLGMDMDHFAKFERHLFAKGAFVLASAKTGQVDDAYLVGDKGTEVVTLRGHLRKTQPLAAFIEVQSWELKADMAARGLGKALIPEFVLKGRHDLKRCKSPVMLPNYEVGLFTRPQTALSASAAQLLEVLRGRAS